MSAQRAVIIVIALEFAEQQFHQLAEAIDPGSAELEDAAGGGRSVERGKNGVGNVTDIDRLNTWWCPPPISGMKGEICAIRAKRLKKSSSGPNTTEGRRMVAVGK